MGKLLEQLSQEISDLAQSVTPSVVTLQVETPSGRSAASGFFKDTRGYIITNAHPFRGGSPQITVLMTDGTSLVGTLIGTDIDTDIAVVKVDFDNPPIAETGDSDRLLMGEFVLTVGSPLFFTTTVTVGIVSATGRRLESLNKRPMSGIIQTDAAINPGSSGGPMFNARGEVVGINTAIIQGTSGLGFAVPINIAKHISEILIEEGGVSRPIIGISVSDADGAGVIIDSVEADSSASMAEIEVGDIIVGIGEKPVRNTDDAYRLISDLAGQASTVFQILRDEEDSLTNMEIEMELLYE